VTDSAPDLLTRREAAAVLKMAPRAVGRLSERGGLPFIWTPGGRRRFPRDGVNQVAASRVTQAGGDAT
jgi:excisionase family DNA binding protein